MNTSSVAVRRSVWPMIFLLAALGLVAAYYWPRQSQEPGAAVPACRPAIPDTAPDRKAVL